MEIKYIKNMRIERNNIRMGLAGAKSNWEKNQLSQRKKLFAKLRKMNATTEKAKELVFLPLEVDHDYFDIPHIYYCERNPIVEYTDGSFHFSVISLKEKLKNKGNSIHNLTTSINEYTKGTVSLKYKESHDLYNGDRWTDIIRIHNRIEKYISTLNCTECIISADGADMTIYRFFQPGCLSGRFALYPAIQLCGVPIEMDEIAFYQLDLASLLLDMIDEIHERKVLLKDYCKGLTVRQLNANSLDIHDIIFWNKKRVIQAAQDYYKKGMNYQDAINLLKRNLMKPLKDYFKSCILSHPESIMQNRGVHNQNNVRTIRIYSEIRNWTLVWVLETVYEGTSYSFILDNKQYSQYALNQYFTKVDEYGRLWNNLVRCFQFEFTKYSKLQTKKII